MCLTGVDYFSTLGYQPGIAFLAAGVLSPIATGIVVLITLFGLVPLYSRVARESPFGQGSIAMLEDLLPGWRGKALILILLGFAATSWVITITLSAADATAHIVENPLIPRWPGDTMAITCALLAVLGLLFLKGFREAIGVSVGIVGLYVLCNAVVISRALAQIAGNPEYLDQWQANLFATHHNIPMMIGVSLILFPKLALGMSGFETGVAVMPLVKGDPDDPIDSPRGRIRNTRKLLLTAALIMAVGLLTSSFVTTALIPPAMFQPDGAANGRALAYLAHEFFGEGFGTVYDISTILILWFAGASAMAGLLNLVPRYLPRYGMAPDWARAQRPLVIVFSIINFIVTVMFRASVDAQAGAYATGVLVLFTSAGFAVTLAVWRESLFRRIVFGTIFLVFVYTTIANMIERPEGLQIASLFIVTILISSLLSRSARAIELRVKSVELDEQARAFIDRSLKLNRKVHLLARRPDGTDYSSKEVETRETHLLSSEQADFVFIEVSRGDPSEFSDEVLQVTGHFHDGFPVLRCRSPATSNAIAAILLHVRDSTGTIPHVYFGWTEGHPLSYVFRYIFFGEGETAPVTREILRRVEEDPARRPKVIVG
ncbi:MAG: amino acid transporter [Candidatus Melainabacteria bacterium]|nr:amino acid transporter [Candidatus Melainabacteria bacterium]